MWESIDRWADAKVRLVLRRALLLAVMACEHDAAEYRRLMGRI